ncbi:MAG: ornithine cyclodeaminase family protein, partial [Proteobacteria bacterium]
NWVTAVRTAGLSAVAAKYLARKDSKVIAFIGSGVQARSHLDAFRQMFGLTEVRAMGRGTSNRDRLCEYAKSLGLSAMPCGTTEEAVSGADIVVTSVTLSYQIEPFIDARWLKEGAFAAITDLGIPWYAEGMEAFDRIVIDDLEQERQMERPLVAADVVAGDITGLVTGAVPGRQGDEERTAFVFRGLSLGDLALAALAWQRYRDAV